MTDGLLERLSVRDETRSVAWTATVGGDCQMNVRRVIRTDDGRLRAGWRATLPVVGSLAAGLSVQVVTLTVAPRAVATHLARIATALIVVAGLLGWRRWQNAPLGSLDSRWALNLGWGLSVGVGLFGAVFGAYLWLGWTKVAAITTGGRLPFVAGVTLAALGYLAVGVWEEIVFRGAFLSNLADGFRRWCSRRQARLLALVVSSVVFGLLHLTQVDGVSLLLWIAWGGILGGAYLLTDSLAVPIGVHAGLDFGFNTLFGLHARTDVATVVRPTYLIETAEPTFAAVSGLPGLVTAVCTALAGIVVWLACRSSAAGRVLSRSPLRGR